jgi:hypothetical protein
MGTVVSDKDELFKCDPAKNVNCPKTRCYYNAIHGECKYTTNPRYSLDGIAYTLQELYVEEQIAKDTALDK